MGFSSATQAEFRHFNNWTKKEKTVFIAYGTASWIDHKQTQWALDNPCQCYKESNKLVYGSDPHRDKSLIVNTIALSTVYWAIGTFEPDVTVPVVGTAAVFRFGVVVSNDQLGASWQVAF
jgi:hypothetical protein